MIFKNLSVLVLWIKVALALEELSHNFFPSLPQPEPFFISVSLYDAKDGKKLSEDFHWDPNIPDIRAMIPQDLLRANDMLNSVEAQQNSQPRLQGLKEDWLAFPKQVHIPCVCSAYLLPRHLSI